MSLLTPHTGIETLLRADQLSLRTPASRTLLLARYTGLRRAVKGMGYKVDLIETATYEGRSLVLAEKVYALLLIYCGLNHEQALTALCQCCNLVMTERMLTMRARAIADAPLHNYIKQVVAKVLLDQAAPLDLSPERTLEELATIAYGNLLDIAEWSTDRGVTPIDSRTLTREQAASIASIKQVIGRDGSVSWEVKMHDKTKPLELFMKHFGMLTEKVEISVDDSLASRIEAARRRAGLAAEERPALEHEG